MAVALDSSTTSLLLLPHTYDVVETQTAAASQQLGANGKAVLPLPKNLLDDKTQGQSYDDQKQALDALVPVRPQLSPSDEANLFSKTDNADANSTDTSTNRTVTSGQAVADDGSKVAVDIIKPNTDSQSISLQLLLFYSQIQQAVSKYAAANDVVFSGGTIGQLAA
jgi:hypothetical protein